VDRYIRPAGAARSLAAVVAAIVFALPAACASRAAVAERASHRGTGVVVAINAEKARVKINHEAIQGYMEAMTMWFDVADPKLLDGVAPNDRVEFVLTEEESADVVTELKKVG
jgi:Cu/Ag efflux protein CusF